MRRALMAAVGISLFAVPALAAELKTEEQKTFYAVGGVIAKQLSVFSLSPQELELVQQGIVDGVTGKKMQVSVEEYQPKIQQMAVARRDAQGKKLAVEGKEFVEKAAKEKGAVKSASGVIYLPVKEGSGAKPAATDKVKVHYRGTLTDGKEFDSSYTAGQPAEFQLDKVIPCWTEGVQQMRVGGKAKLVCPPETAYAEKGAGIIPPNATLVFEVELLDVVK